MPKRRSIFIVDDDKAILEYYRKVFNPEVDEFNILGVPSAWVGDSVALRLFARPSELLAAFSIEQEAGRSVPLCIVDMRMPEQSGLELSVALRHLDPEISIIICSAFSDATADTLKERLNAGVFLVHKPFAADEFKLLVHSLLREWEGRRTLKRNEERLRRIIEATRVGTWEWNLASGETVFNERWAEIVGYTLAELAPVSIATWSRLVHPEDSSRSEELLDRHFSGELPYYDIECRMKHKDGHWVWVHDRGQVVERDETGAPLLMSGTHTDITQRKEAEAELLEIKSQELRSYADELSEKVVARTQALEQAQDALMRQEKMASIGRLASGVAHEINNPIGYIQANLTIFTEYMADFRAAIEAGEALARAVEGGRPEELAQAAEALAELRKEREIDYLLGDTDLLLADSRKGAIRIGEIVQGLKAFARDDGGSQAICDVNAIVAASLRMIESKLKYTCKVELDLGILSQVQGNPGQIEQVFVNLLANAGEAIAEHGTIGIRSREVYRRLKLPLTLMPMVLCMLAPKILVPVRNRALKLRLPVV
jgi:PAS domain S-box-containing protein